MDTPNHDAPATSERIALIESFQDMLELMEWQDRQIFAKVVLSPHHLTLPQMTILRVLSEAEEEIDMAELATRSGLPAGSVTGIMDRLVLRRLVERREILFGRRILGRITPAGIEAFEGIRDSRLDLVTSLVSDYTDEEIAQLIELIRRWTVIAAALLREQSDDTPVTPIPAD